MAPPFEPADATVGEGAGGGDSTGTGDTPGDGLDSSHVDGDTILTVRGEFRLGAGPTETRKLEEEELLLLLSASSSDLRRLMKNLPGMPTGHSLSCC